MSRPLGPGEYPVSRAPKPEPGDWMCESNRCSGNKGGKPFVNFSRNMECRICGEKRPPQPCAYWLYNGSCRRHAEYQDCRHTHREEDKGRFYGEGIPDYVLGKGGSRDRAPSQPSWPQSWQGYDTGAQQYPNQGGGFGSAWTPQQQQPQQQWEGSAGGSEEGDMWHRWATEKVPVPTAEEVAAIDRNAREEMKRYLLILECIQNDYCLILK